MVQTTATRKRRSRPWVEYSGCCSSSARRNSALTRAKRDCSRSHAARCSATRSSRSTNAIVAPISSDGSVIALAMIRTKARHRKIRKALGLPARHACAGDFGIRMNLDAQPVAPVALQPVDCATGSNGFNPLN